jgi:hypothetical protein
VDRLVDVAASLAWKAYRDVASLVGRRSLDQSDTPASLGDLGLAYRKARLVVPMERDAPAFPVEVAGRHYRAAVDGLASKASFLAIRGCHKAWLVVPMEREEAVYRDHREAKAGLPLEVFHHLIGRRSLDQSDTPASLGDLGLAYRKARLVVPMERDAPAFPVEVAGRHYRAAVDGLASKASFGDLGLAYRKARLVVQPEREEAVYRDHREAKAGLPWEVFHHLKSWDRCSVTGAWEPLDAEGGSSARSVALLGRESGSLVER